MKNPNLKIKYAKGLGDIIASFLHSKPIGWFVHLITGRTEPCHACTQRAMALNIHFPIPVWKLFFKNTEELQKSFLKDIQDSGYQIISDEKSPENVLIKNEIAPDARKEIQKRLNEQLESKLLKPLNKKLLSTNKTEIGDYIVQVNIFQK
jgi:hypothetical protein